MALRIVSADERLAEQRGIKACIFGKSGMGKTSLLWTLPPQTTLFADLEAGDLAVNDWPGATVAGGISGAMRDHSSSVRSLG